MGEVNRIGKGLEFRSPEALLHQSTVHKAMTVEKKKSELKHLLNTQKKKTRQAERKS